MYRNTFSLQTSFKAGYSPRSSLRLLLTSEKQLLDKLSLGFDRFILNSLKPRFTQKGLDELEFIQVLLKGLQGFDSEMPQRQLRLVNAIHVIYQDITMGKAEKVTWQMFSNHLINNIRCIKSKQQTPHSYSKSQTHSKAKFTNPIVKCIYVKQMELLMMYEQNSNKVLVVDSKKGILSPHFLDNQPRKLAVQTSVVKKDKGKTVISSKQLVIPTDVIVMDILYLNQPKFDVLLCSTSDGCIKGWRYFLHGFQLAMQPESQNLPMSHMFPSPIYSMSWDQINQVLYCGSEKGTIYAWPFKTDTELPLQTVHESMVMCMCYISKLQILASGGMDGKLILWDIVSNNKKVYKYHNRGILTIVMSEDLLLFSGGFDHQICVWNPYISGLVHRINTHTSTILSMSINGNYLMSLDAQNTIRITNVKNFEPVFGIVLSNEKSKYKASCMSFVSNPNRIVVCSNKIYFYDYDQDKNADLSDNIPIENTFYLENNFKLYSWTVERIKIWNMLTGQLEQTFSNVCQYQISCVFYQKHKHYILIGDVSGYINMINLKTCQKVKQLPRQPLAVDFIIPIKAIKQHDLLAIISGFTNVNIYKIIPEGYQLTKTFQMAKNTQITSAIYNQPLRQLILGTNVGNMEFYDVENGKMSMATTTLDIYSNIVAIEVIWATHVLVLEIAYMGSVSIIYRMQDSLHRIYHFKIMDTQNKSQLLRINTACWNKQSIFFLGDEKGYIVACSFKPVLDQIKSTKYIGELKKNVQILYKVRAHHQSIISMTYIQQQKLLISTAFDKRIKIWNSQTGEAIDYLRQQPHYNQMANPIYFWRVDELGKYDVRKADITQQVLLKSSVIQPSPQDIVFNPKWLLDNIVLLNNLISNIYWKVHVQFEDKCKHKVQKCLRLIQQLAMKKKSKFQLLIKRQENTSSNPSIHKQLKLSLQKHIRHSSAISSVQLSPRNQKQLPRLQRPPKLDMASRAQLNAHKKFQQDIAMIDIQLKHQIINKSTSHHSLNNRKSTVLSSWGSKQYQSRQRSLDKKSIINLSTQEKNALSRLSNALRSVDMDRTLKYDESIKVKMHKK